MSSILVDEDSFKLVVADAEAGKAISGGDTRNDNSYTHIISVIGDLSLIESLKHLITGTPRNYDYHVESLSSAKNQNWKKVFAPDSNISQYIETQKLAEHSAESPRRILVCGNHANGDDPSLYVALLILVQCWESSAFEALKTIRERTTYDTKLHKNAVEAFMDARNLDGT